MTTTLQIRLDQKMKNEANKTFKSMGLDMSTGVKLFLAQVVNTKSIPFPVMSADYWPEEKKKKIMRELNRELVKIRSGKAKLYDDISVMHREILGK